MELSKNTLPKRGNKLPKYDQKLAAVLEARPDNLTIAPEYLDAMSVALATVYRRYGKKGKSYQPYHNDIHSFNVATGSWRVLDFMRDELNLDIQDSDYIVGGLTGTLHDIIHEGVQIGIIDHDQYVVNFGKFKIAVMNDGTKTDEMLSAEAAVLYLNKLGLPDEIQQNVHEGILLTEVEYTDGNVIQKGAGKAGRNFGAIAAAIADTEGIFSGEDRIEGDQARLVAETMGEKLETADDGIIASQVKKFMDSQTTFVNQKIEEFALHMFGTQSDPGKLQDFQDRFQQHFKPLRDKALGTAAMFDTKLSDYQVRQNKIIARIESLRQIGRIGSSEAKPEDNPEA